MRLIGRLPAVLLPLLLLAAAANPPRAQRPDLRGRVVDPDGRPVAGISVTLHHVTDSGGAEVGRAISAADGSFAIEMREIEGGGVYFAATRFDGALYMGNPFHTLAEATDDYRIVIGVGGIAGGAAAPELARPADRTGWVVLLFVLLGAGAVIVPLRRARRGPFALRTILADLAELEEENARRPAAGRLATDTEYRARRDALRTRLREFSGAPVHAADSH
jgi:hypothetical protein